MNQLVPFGPGAKVFIGIYLLSLFVIGAFGYRARKKHSMRDFYLAGNGIGFVVLLLTLYSTQYSGNTMLGFSGKAYRIGLSWVTCVHFMTAIVVVYLTFAPQLFRLAKQRDYITPTDFLADRFGHTPLNVLATCIMVIAISNYLLAQLMAMGSVLEGLAPEDADTKRQAYYIGVGVLALIIVIYESLGGFRAVVWTDVIQGSVLVVGFFVLLMVVLNHFGGLGDAVQTLMDSSEHRHKVAVPNGAWQREWISYILMVGIGGALYPQSIQRLYAAESASALRRSLMVMAFFPLTTALIAVIVGVIAAANIEGLEGDSVLFVVCREIQQESFFGYCLVVVLFSGVLAAVMSTADSVLLSISSMVTKDLYGRLIRTDASEKHLTKFGKAVSWVLMVVLVFFAIELRGTTLVNLLDRKFDLLVQLGPAFLIGVHSKKIRGDAIFLGISVGVAIALSLAFAVNSKPFDIHPGLYGLVANLSVVAFASMGPKKA
ncbi:MAG: sodium:solute symporter family protein [Planctomycetales bacterium]|nr:sodium:solute symporter family protein [Planctomycetales bacterium]